MMRHDAVTIICTICGAMSRTDAQAEKHFMEYHFATDWKECPFWVRFAGAMFRAEEPAARKRIAIE